jgi:predicted PurR-regulated permease PerM
MGLKTFKYAIQIYYFVMYEDEEKRGWGIAALVFAIASLVFIILPFLGLLFALLALIFSFVQHDTLSRGAKRIAITSLLINMAFLVLFALVLGAAANKIGSSLDEFKEIKNKIGKATDKIETIEEKTKGLEEKAGRFEQTTGQYKECPGHYIDRPEDCDGKTIGSFEQGFCCVDINLKNKSL